ncbi:hypothetical protein MLD38_025195 [Melastoma candidum]|uniref:Uncharacterized protein n=1 Tax=Melastoma candidum TaxID=119954 RepID=A0ACB9NUB2_9MYRT|nr:hypothetical protein MLD38_025195 [Melastoma candidum]
MTSPKSFHENFLSLLLLLLHLGCFIFSSSAPRRGGQNHDNVHPPPQRLLKKRFKPRRALSSSLSFFKRILSPRLNFCSNDIRPHPSTTTLSSARASHRSVLSLVNSSELLLPPHPESLDEIPDAFGECDISCENPFLPLRNDIFPCTSCGEVFPKPHLLEQHQAVRHAVSELLGEESGMNIVNIIFRAGWSDRDRVPKIDRILKIHNGQGVLSRFEEHRESVKSKAARIGCGTVSRKRDERCIADGNELLRFHCSTLACDLGVGGNSALCNQQHCNICGIIMSGFSPKLEGISTLSSGYRAHLTVPDDIVEEFQFMNVKKAMLICRVIAGRVATADDADKDGGFDSYVARGSSGRVGSPAAVRADEEELVVFNPRAVLPCFVIVYSV